MSAEKVHIDVHRCAQTHLGAIVAHVELDFGWQTMGWGALVSQNYFYFPMPSKCLSKIRY